jgi:Na+/H+ antiporter NhaD/arsenite permease-like protein
MNLAVLSVLALAFAIIVSCVTPLNVGVLAIALAWIIGVYVGGIPVGTVMGGFPTQLFLTLTGVTLLFTLAQCNGTLDKLAHHAVRSCRGNRGVIPIMFFVLAAALASMGPGNIATAAILAPMAMATASRVGIPLFLMAIMVGNGANSGSLSPFAPTGIIVNGLMARNGLTGYEIPTYLYNLGAHALVAFGGYFLFGGLKLFARNFSGIRLQPDSGRLQADSGRLPFDSRSGHPERSREVKADATGKRPNGVDVATVVEDTGAFKWQHWLTLGVIAGLILSVLIFEVNVGMGAFFGAVVLVLLRAADDGEAIKRMPWRVIVMVCGVTVLIALLERAQGIDLLVSMVARISSPRTVTGVIAFITGVVSVYSSTSGVVLPAFLPMVPGLSQQIVGASAIGIASAMNIGGHLVDVSPLSTIGALCIAGAPVEESRRLFNQLLAWGLSMSIVGAILCWVLF